MDTGDEKGWPAWAKEKEGGPPFGYHVEGCWGISSRKIGCDWSEATSYLPQFIPRSQDTKRMLVYQSSTWGSGGSKVRMEIGGFRVRVLWLRRVEILRPLCGVGKDLQRIGPPGRGRDSLT